VGPTGGPGGSPTSRAPYLRQETPGWLPADWQVAIDDRDEPYFQPGTTSTGGDCQRSEAGLVRATTPTGIVSGCVTPSQAYTDVAIEVEVTVLRGCAVLWVRTGAVGYLLRLCGTQAILHSLGSAGASDENTVGTWDLPGRPENMVVGMLATGTATIVVYADGQEIGRFVDTPDKAIPRGKVNVGVFPLSAEGAEATFRNFKAWAPPSP
jgi:hypothetical protein